MIKLVVWGRDWMCLLMWVAMSQWLNLNINLAITRTSAFWWSASGFFQEICVCLSKFKGCMSRFVPCFHWRWKRKRLLGSSQSIALVVFVSLSPPRAYVLTQAPARLHLFLTVIFDVHTYSRKPPEPTDAGGRGRDAGVAGFHHRAATSLPHKLEVGVVLWVLLISSRIVSWNNFDLAAWNN